jgi:hypothetical protein
VEQGDGGNWTIEEDNTLAHAKNKYGTNWDLICDIVNSLPRPIRRKRNKKHVFERWKNHFQGKDTIPIDPASEVQTEQKPQFNILDLIKKTLQKKKTIPGRLGSAAETEAPVQIHPSHAQVCFIC